MRGNASDLRGLAEDLDKCVQDHPDAIKHNPDLAAELMKTRDKAYARHRIVTELPPTDPRSEPA